jgi:hypothetical protein
MPRASFQRFAMLASGGYSAWRRLAISSAGLNQPAGLLV